MKSDLLLFSLPRSRNMRAMEANTLRNVIVYLRVSTDEQARGGLGIAAQRTTIEQQAEHRGWIVTYATDDGYTASNLKRPALLAALDSLRSGEADALVVSKLDRLSRSLMDFASLMETARSEGWAVIALDLGVDMSTPAGEMLSNVLASFAQYERRLISQRTTDALAELRRQGVQLGRPRVLNDDLVATCAAWRAVGCTYASIADRLNDDGTPTAHGGERWHASTVRAVLKSHERRQEAAA
ncbi:recombinase family protein [Ilumatobacter coccineus]|nr:recombinase family protein [Ilumatobacter coccineus]